MGWPNCSRTLAYSTLMSRQRRAAPSISADAQTAARRSRDSSTGPAVPGWPTTASAPTPRPPPPPLEPHLRPAAAEVDAAHPPQRDPRLLRVHEEERESLGAAGGNQDDVRHV